MTGTRAGNVTVRGGASAEELAAVLTVLERVTGRPPVEQGYARWRRIRLSALRREADVTF